MGIWKVYKKRDWEHFCLALEAWRETPTSFWNKPPVQKLFQSDKIIPHPIPVLNLIENFHNSKDGDFGFDNFENISPFKKAAVFIELFTRDHIFRVPRSEFPKLNDDEKRCIRICNYLCAWDIAFNIILESEIPGDDGIEKKPENPIKLSKHIRAEIIEQDMHGRLLPQGRAFIIEALTYIFNPDMFKHRDSITCEDGGCDPYLSM